MYLNILKKAMNVILPVFIILATMFVSSSVNNIMSVTTALDNYLKMANAPDYLTMTIDKSIEKQVKILWNGYKNFTTICRNCKNFSL